MLNLSDERHEIVIFPLEEPAQNAPENLPRFSRSDSIKFSNKMGKNIPKQS